LPRRQWDWSQGCGPPAWPGPSSEASPSPPRDNWWSSSRRPVDAVTAAVPARLDALNIAAADWDESLVDPTSLPPRSTLKPLPEGAAGDPVLTSNNPEVFRDNGTLFGTLVASPARGGGRHALTGSFGFYVHHLHRSTRTKTVSVVARNDGTSDATVTFFGSGYTRTETGGLGLGTSPDARVSAE
jgi:hypothetical protein